MENTIYNTVGSGHIPASYQDFVGHPVQRTVRRFFSRCESRSSYYYYCVCYSGTVQVPLQTNCAVTPDPSYEDGNYYMYGIITSNESVLP